MQNWFIGMAAALLLVTGCQKAPPQPAFDDLHPATGTVTRGGAPVVGGAVQFTAEPEKPEFIINSEVGPDGRFTLTTVRTTDSSGERRPGAPAGQYRVTYMPQVLDQTAGNLDPIVLTKTVTIGAQSNDLTIELPAR